MNEKSIANIACKVLAIYVIILGIKNISYLLSISLFPYISQGFNKSTIIQMIFVSILPSIIYITMGLVLWFKSIKISNYMIHDNEDILIEKSKLDVIELQTVAFSVVGLVILVNLIPDFFRLLSKLLYFKSGYIPKESVEQLEIKISIIEIIIRFIVGLLLLLKSRGVVGFIKNMQKAGVKDLDR